jgi:hypothetical protein
VPQPLLSVRIDGQKPGDPFGGSQFARSKMLSLNPIVHHIGADPEVRRYFCHRAFLRALKIGDGNRMFESNPANRRNRQPVAFLGFHASLIQVLNHLLIIRMLGECPHLLHECRIVPPLF